MPPSTARTCEDDDELSETSAHNSHGLPWLDRFGAHLVHGFCEFCSSSGGTLKKSPILPSLISGT